MVLVSIPQCLLRKRFSKRSTDSYFLILKGGTKDAYRCVITEIGNLSLDINNYREQGYDEATPVSGHINDLSAHIPRINEKAVYTHYHSH